MNQLCLLTNLTSSDWAAWVQAIGSIVAIVGAAWIAIWQSRRLALAVLREEQRHAQIESARTLLALSTNCARAMKHTAGQFTDRMAVHRIAEQQAHFDFNVLRVLEGAVLSIPLHSLPYSLVSPTMIVNSTVRQFREKVESALRSHREMNSAAFEDFFSTVAQMQSSLAQRCSEIEAVVAVMRARRSYPRESGMQRL